jgi:hypothetical protein
MTAILKIHHIKCMQELALKEGKIHEFPPWIDQLT